MAISYRDLKRKTDERFDKKTDKRQQFRAVIVDQFGNQSGAGDIWFNRSQRKVWAMKVGGTQPYPYYCYRIKPSIGVGVIIGYSSPLNQLPEVLQTDTEFLGPSNTTGTAYESPDNEDFLPGGRLQLWLDTRLIQSLAIYPDATGLFVNVTNGDYIYAGERKTFDGEENIDLSASQPGAGLHRYVGLYLDSSNLLQTVDGATIALASTPAQPTWPDGSYRLGMVRINDTQTSFSMADDVVNLKIPWNDEESFGTGVWPADGEIKINDTLYATLALAIAAAVSGDIIRLGSGTFTCNNLTLPNGVSLIGSDMTLTILSQTTDANCLTTGTTGDVSNLKISLNINSANNRTALTLAGDNFIENVWIVGNNAGGGRDDGVLSASSNDPVLTDCIVTSLNGYAVLANNSNTIVTLNMGNYFGGVRAVEVTLGLVKLLYPQLNNAPTAFPASKGIWFDAGATPQTQLQGKAVWFNSATTAPVNLTERSAAPSSPVTQDVYLDDGTNTGTAQPSFRRYNGAAWEDIGPIAASETVKGVAEIATQTETDTGTDDLRIVTPLKLASAKTVTTKVKNTSGATVAAGDVGYVTRTSGAGIEFKTTTTAIDNRIGGVAVVITGGANNADIYVSYRGRYTIPYAGSAPAAGDFLVFSTTAGKVALQTTMRFEVIAVAQAAGSGGTVDALLLTDRIYTPLSSTEDIFRVDASSKSNFTGTINGTPSGSTLVYTITGGTNENSIKPASAGELAKIVLHNTTRGTSLLIDSVDLGTNTITFTSAVPGAWANGDVITTRSQTNTNTDGTSYFVDYDLTSADNTVIPLLTTAMHGWILIIDSGSGTLSMHPFAAFSASQTPQIYSQTGNTMIIPIPLISQKFTIKCEASGSGTATYLMRLTGVTVAAP